MSFVLRITNSDGALREINLDEGEVSVGRDPQNRVVLGGRGVSRRHAKFVLRQGRLTVVDLGSTYGTRVNRMPTLRRSLTLGDKITIGMHDLEVQQAPKGNTSELPLILDQSTPYFPDEVTHDPRATDDEAVSTPLMSQPLNPNSIQFISDTKEESEVELLPRDSGKILEAVERLEREKRIETGEHAALTATIAPRTADYHALLLMYKVSRLLGEAQSLDAFIALVADLVMDEAQANTVVVLMGNNEDEMKPVVIRHRGALDPGEVPISRGILELVMRNRSSVISADAGADDRIKPGRSLALYNIRVVVAAPLMLLGEIRGVIYLNRAGPIPFTKAEGEMVSALAALLASGIERAELKESVTQEQQRRAHLERFHPPEVVNQLFAAQGKTVTGLAEHRATALVCDMKSFDTLWGSVAPGEFAGVLDEFYDMLYEKVFANGGTVVKLIGGWALALFGMHSTVDRDSVWAVAAARQIAEEFLALSVLWPASQDLSLRCALDTGPVIAGVVGNSERLEYVAVGAPVSGATEMATKPTRTALVLSEETWQTLPQKRFQVKVVGTFQGERTLYEMDI
ncbi:MAG: FHA domain-containing protein [Deltaproteobacteria bacterium]|nr:FHA domain-containing protein [Deltaproteobacteria bacterium]